MKIKETQKEEKQLIENKHEKKNQFTQRHSGFILYSFTVYKALFYFIFVCRKENGRWNNIHIACCQQILNWMKQNKKRKIIFIFWNLSWLVTRCGRKIFASIIFFIHPNSLLSVWFSHSLAHMLSVLSFRTNNFFIVAVC